MKEAANRGSLSQRDLGAAILRLEYTGLSSAQLHARHRKQNSEKYAIQQMTPPGDRFAQVSSASGNSDRVAQNEGHLSEPLTLILRLLVEREFGCTPMPEHRSQNASHCKGKNEKPNDKMRVH